MKNLVTIKEYEINQESKLDGNLMISLPPVWVRAQRFKVGDKILYLQTPGSNDLILRKSDSNIQSPNDE